MKSQINIYFAKMNIQDKTKPISIINNNITKIYIQLSKPAQNKTNLNNNTAYF